MKRNIFILLFLLVGGCVSTEPQDQPFYQSKKNLTQAQRVYLGMDLKEVHALMGQEILVGYQQDEKTQKFKPMNVKNPHRAEKLSGQGREYYVEYYLTDIKKEDGIISNDELTPFIFENNELIGKGWNYLFRLKNIINLK